MGLFLLVLIGIVLYFVFKTPNRIKLPPPSTLNLPARIRFEQTTNDNYHLGTLALDVFTIGGHGRLKQAKYDYEVCYGDYVTEFNKSIDIRQHINAHLNEIGRTTYQVLSELERSRNMLNQPIKGREGNRISKDVNLISDKLYRLENVAQQRSDSGMVLFQGASIGGLAAVGSWTLVSTFGAASTGTAIASLSGVAAQNAILAWFGGGAIAAGGGGIAAGTATLGLIFAAPIVLFSSYKTHSSANELNDRVTLLKQETLSVKETNRELTPAIDIVKERLDFIKQKHEFIKSVNDDVYKLLYPNGKMTKVKRTINSIFNRDYYTKDEAAAIDRLLVAMRHIDHTLDENVSPKQLAE